MKKRSLIAISALLGLTTGCGVSNGIVNATNGAVYSVQGWLGMNERTVQMSSSPSPRVRPILEPREVAPGGKFSVTGRYYGATNTEASIFLISGEPSLFPDWNNPGITLLEQRVIKITSPDMELSEEFTAPNQIGSYYVIVNGAGRVMMPLAVR